jgi:hypothetical protein
MTAKVWFRDHNLDRRKFVARLDPLEYDNLNTEPRARCQSVHARGERPLQ